MFSTYSAYTYLCLITFHHFHCLNCDVLVVFPLKDWLQLSKINILVADCWIHSA